MPRLTMFTENFPTRSDGKRLDMDPVTNPFQVVIPHRVFPGRLSVRLYHLMQTQVLQVSRAFGDIEAKLERFGGNPHVVIAKPEITKLQLTSDHDFILMGSKNIIESQSNLVLSR